MIYGSVCSGIEAATMAWHPLGWKAAWYSEIEKFPSAVLAHRYPETPNLGDMTQLEKHAGRTRIDLLVGGTPCQSFSVAGLRKGMADARGNLALVFILLLRRTRARWILWENVPGVLSSGNDFGCFLGGLVGRELAHPEEGWGNAGVLEQTTPKDYGLAWRILDAQYFGVPQRRRRVFVVGHLGDWRRAAAVLFEREGLPGYPAAGEEEGKGPARTLRARANSSHREDTDNFVTHTLRGEGHDASEDGTGRGIPLVPIAHVDKMPTLRAAASQDGPGHGARSGDSKDEYIIPMEPIPIDMRQASRGEKMTNNRPEGSSGGPPGTGIGNEGDHAPTIAASHVPAVFDMRGRGDGKTVPTLCTDHASRPSDYCPVVMAIKDDITPKFSEDKAFTLTQPSPSGGGHPQAIAFTQNQVGDVLTGDVVPAMGTNQNATGRNTPKIFQQNSRSEVREMGNKSGAVTSEPGAQCQNYLNHGSMVRRLTPRECERLQGFPDDYTLIPYGGGQSKDGPRYKALGNSMAVPVMAWIGARIQAVEEITTKRP